MIWYDMSLRIWKMKVWVLEYENMKIQEKKIWKVRTGDMSARIWKNAEYSNFSPQPHNEKCHAQTKIYLLKNSNKGDLAKDLNISWISQSCYFYSSPPLVSEEEHKFGGWDYANVMLEIHYIVAILSI